MTRKPKWTSESVGEYEQSLKPIEQPKVRTGNCLRVGVCALEGHKIAPQRTWVGLSNAEVKKIVGSDRYTDLLEEVVKIVEAKLKEKNT